MKLFNWDSFLEECALWLRAIFIRPNYETPVAQEPMNQPPEPVNEYEGPRAESILIPANELLAETAQLWIGKDASPKNRAPKELSCAEGVVNIVNQAFPGTLHPDIVGTDALDLALRRSKRFKPVLDPAQGCIEVSPRTATVNGHCGIYVYNDKIASNDSRTGKFQINYTRQTWRDYFIKKKGLKAHLFLPVDL